MTGLYKVFLVDDCEFDLNGIAEYIEWDKLDCVLSGTAMTGIEGTNLIASVKPDIVISDIALPDMNGLELAKHILSEAPKTKFVFISCLQDFEYAKAAIDINCIAYITKPIKLEELTAAIVKAAESIRLDEVLELNKFKSVSLNYTSDMIEELTNIFDTNNSEEINAFIDEYIGPDDETDIASKQVICIQMINCLKELLKRHNHTVSDVFGDEYIIWKKIINFESILCVKQWVHNLISFSVRYVCNEDKQTNDTLFLEVMSYVNSNYNEQNILNDLSEHLNLSINYLSTIFKSVYGVTLYDYVIDKRIHEAKKLLTQTNMSVTDIAKKIGYSNNAYFTTAFKNRVGMTPLQFKKNFLKAK